MPLPTEPELPRRPGTYVLWMRAANPFQLSYGRHRRDCEPGHYLYVGSAFGPGGLAARIGHHLRVSARPRWHIDRLRQHTPVARVWFSLAETRLEHRWAQSLAAACDEIVPRFGASDCGCDSHLFWFRQRPATTLLAAAAAGTVHVFEPPTGVCGNG